jgi:hypothetical protein
MIQCGEDFFSGGLYETHEETVKKGRRREERIDVKVEVNLRGWQERLRQSRQGK